MGYGLSLYTVYQVARISAPTVAEALIGRGDRQVYDQRLAGFGRRVVARARMRLTVEGAAALPAARAFVYMSNHQSHLDIPVLFATCPARTLRMVAKRELFQIPLFGRAMRRADFVEVDRGDRAQAVASLERAGQLIKSGVSVWIAPEGSRSRTGELGPLKKGGFHLALGTGTPIVPVAIRGTYDILPPDTTAMRYDQPVTVRYGAPIEVVGRSIESLMAEVEGFLRRAGVAASEAR